MTNMESYDPIATLLDSLARWDATIGDLQRISMIDLDSLARAVLRHLERSMVQ